jgi:putative tryptophan/tyrosine transport system substrate-binding protein
MSTRREFITLIGSAVVAWPLAARAQQQERTRRIGVLMTTAADDPEGQARVAAFLQGLQQWGWTVGGNVRIDTRFGADNAATRKHASDLASLAPDVILANSSAAVGPLLQATRTVPIVFAVVADPVGAGFVESLARPGGNATGFTIYEYSMSGKWLELLKEIAPGVTRVAVIRDPTTAVGLGQFGAIQAVAPSLGVEVSPINLRDAGEIEPSITAFVRSSNSGLIVTGSPLAVGHRDLIFALAARYKLPAVYPARFFAAAGGLISYGPDFLDQFRRAAGYVDRILKGEKPAPSADQWNTIFDVPARSAREKPLPAAAALGPVPDLNRVRRCCSR